MLQTNSTRQKDTIILSRMYGGKYIAENLGGEAINLLADDKGNNFIYINPYGYIDSKYDDRVSHVVLTRYIKDIGWEIIAVAEIDQQLIKFNGKKRGRCCKILRMSARERETRCSIITDR